VIAHLRKGLEVLLSLPETPERVQREIDLLLALAQALGSAKGGATPERGRVLHRARELCQHMGDTTRLFSALEGLFSFHGVSGQIKTCREIAEQLVTLAQHRQDPSSLIGAHRALGTNLFYYGNLVQARTHLEQAIALHDAQQDYALLLNPSGTHRGLLPRAIVDWLLWVHGYPDQALQRSGEALARARELAHPYSLAYVLANVVRVYAGRRELQTTWECAQELLALCTERGFTYLLPCGAILEGWVVAMQGETASGIARIRQGLEEFRTIEAELNWTYFLTLLAEAYAKAAQTQEGLTVVEEGLTLVQNNEERFYEAELYRLKGALLLERVTDQQREVESLFRQALALAHHQQAKSLELRAAISLSRLWQQQGKRAEAYALLAPIYGWFTEGFDTADLQDAKALLEALA
jgi:predicted ATPase